MNKELYNAITEYRNKYGNRNFGRPDNMEAYDNLVSMCIQYDKIPECNRHEYSCHSCLLAAITYESNRERFCK